MARTLESLLPGTAVFAGSTNVGTVTGLYTEGDNRSVEVVVVAWTARGEDVAVPAAEIASIDDEGVHLMRTEADQQQDLAPFDAGRFATLKRLA